MVPNGDDTFAVVASGRRLDAVQRLAEAGEIPAAYVAPCRVSNGGADPAEMSLHENEKRAPMHPADQYAAYARLRAKGMTAAESASRAGVSERQVTKMMRLASVAPELLAALRNGEMNLETLMAFTVTDDHEAQLDVCAKARQAATAWRDHIREQLTEGAVSGGSGLASFVGLEAYEQAGGRVQRDLFSQFDHDAVYLLDPASSRSSPKPSFRRPPTGSRSGGSGSRSRSTPTGTGSTRSTSSRGVPGTPTAAEQKRVDELADELQDIADSPPMDPAQQSAAYARGEKLDAKYEKLQARIAASTKYLPEDMRIAGCIVILKGARADVITGLVLPEDVPPKPTKTARKKAAEAPANTPEAAGANPANRDGEPAAPPPTFDERVRGALDHPHHAQPPEPRGRARQGRRPERRRHRRPRRDPHRHRPRRAGQALRRGVRPRGLPARDGHVDARRRTPRRHPPRPHDPAPDEPQQRERLRRREPGREAREPARRPLDEARRRPDAVRRVPRPPRRREARPLRPRRLRRAPQPGRQPAPPRCRSGNAWSSSSTSTSPRRSGPPRSTSRSG